MKKSVLALVVMSAIVGVAQAAEEGRAQTPPGPEPCTSLQDFRDTDCTLTWYGITLYGAYDVGLGWVWPASITSSAGDNYTCRS